jgi:hypothetical protein
MAGNVTVIRAAEQPLLESTRSPLSSRRLLAPETFGGRAGVSWIRLSGAHARQNSGPNERFYYILSGSVVFQVDGEPPRQAQAGDIVYMPKNCDYTFEGDITYLYINVALG